MNEGGVEWFDHPMREPVEIHDATEAWIADGDEWVDKIKNVLAPLSVVVDHIGSTSVPGLAAKPVIDIQVQVPELLAESSYVPHLERLGLVLRARGTDFRFIRPPAGRPRTVHVHVCEKDSTWAREHLAFRDALRANPATAHSYENLKRELARTATSREDYTRGKENFIRKVVEAHLRSHR